MLIALLSIGIGATILAGLVTIYVDVPRQMGAQFRSFGANMLILSDGEKGMSKAQLDKALENIPAGQLVGAAPYRYVRVDMTTRQQSFTAAGTDFDQITKTSPYFSIEGRYPRRSLRGQTARSNTQRKRRRLERRNSLCHCKAGRFIKDCFFDH